MSEQREIPAAPPEPRHDPDDPQSAIREAIDGYRDRRDRESEASLARLCTAYPHIAASQAARLQIAGERDLPLMIYDTILPAWRNEDGIGIFNNLAVLACQQDDYDQAWRWVRHALAVDPRGGGELAFQAGKTAQYIGNRIAFWRGLEAAKAVAPDDIRYWSASYVETAFRSRPDAAQAGGPANPAPMPAGERPDRPAMAEQPVRIALVGRDFDNIASFNRLYGPFRHLPALGFDIVCVSIRNSFNLDKAHIPGFVYHNVPENDEPALTAKLRELAPDIIFDLVSHGAPTAYLSYFRRPAPLILGWAGSGISSGTTVFDGFVTDPILCPHAAERHYTERVVRLPGPSVTVEPLASYPDSSGLPADRNGFVTFGAYHRLSKVTPDAIDLWGRILAKLPGSRIVLKTAFAESPVVQASFRQQIASHGISGERIEIQPMTPPPHHQTVVANTDITLTPFPEQGLVTDFDHLWMGIPTIAYAIDDRPCARLTSALAAAAGAPFLATRTPEEYVNLAVDLASDKGYLLRARKSYRTNLVNAGMTDHARTAGMMAEAIRSLWRDIRMDGRSAG